MDRWTGLGSPMHAPLRDNLTPDPPGVPEQPPLCQVELSRRAEGKDGHIIPGSAQLPCHTSHKAILPLQKLHLAHTGTELQRSPCCKL